MNIFPLSSSPRICIAMFCFHQLEATPHRGRCYPHQWRKYLDRSSTIIDNPPISAPSLYLNAPRQYALTERAPVCSRSLPAAVIAGEPGYRCTTIGIDLRRQHQHSGWMPSHDHLHILQTTATRSLPVSNAPVFDTRRRLLTCPKRLNIMWPT